ncbi:MAG: Type secretory pathway VirB4 component-like protein [Patescibacteria group bacterium]|jgi:type IV secretory pathway VirB4 component|nr:Type secretory pathway VirB4 component-like protein [Patescibacteria group bacterium]
MKLPFGHKDSAEETKRAIQEAAYSTYQEGLTTTRDIIAPSDFVVTPNYLQLGNFYVRTLFVYTYPRYLNTNWLSPVINYDVTMDIGMFIVPQDVQDVMQSLRRKLTQLESTRQIEQEKGLVRDPELDIAVHDIDELRDTLAQGQNRLFQFGIYFTLYAKSLDELTALSKQVSSTLGGMLIYTKEALVQMEQGFNSTLPLGNDELGVLRNLDTGSLSTTFPFTTAELTSDEGILYGINRHNDSLILFDRFNLENANSVVFATSGAGKSYFVKLEILRYLMLGVDVIVIDPENEYEKLAEAVGGSYLEINLNSPKRINPFDLPLATNADEQEDALRSNITTLHGLFRLMAEGLTPEEDALLDKALYECYALKDITTDPATQHNPPPIMSDLVSVLSNLRGAENLILRLNKYVEGTFATLFNQPTNFTLSGGLVVFSVRDLEEALRPVAIFTILNYIWNNVRSESKRRLMVVDEAWWMMQYEDSARFLYGLAKRARKYFLGLTIISQDVEDFLSNKYGKAVVSNSSMQVLLKQSTSSIDVISQVFNLTEQEKYLLLNAAVGEGLFFAGLNHVAIKITASYTEDQIITTDPKQLLAMRSGI